MHILHNNSLPKIDEIRLIAKQSNPSIIRISKSKLHTSILNSAVATEDYDLIRIGQSGRRSYMLYTFFISNAYAIYLFKVNNRNTRTRREICSKLTIKTPEWRQWLWIIFSPLEALIKHFTNGKKSGLVNLPTILAFSSKFIPEVKHFEV